MSNKKESYTAPSREGKFGMTVYLPPQYKRGMRLLQAETDMNQQEMIAAALDELFKKYNVAA
jgi:hypothetical protein